jgi:GntR family transcriptional regulator
VEKVHAEDGRPEALSTVYVDPAIYARFPVGADGREKMIRLLRDHGAVRIVEINERISVGPADLRVTELLECPLAYPVARVHHSVLDERGRIVFYADTIYRGDRFVIERNITDLLESRTPRAGKALALAAEGRSAGEDPP